MNIKKNKFVFMFMIIISDFDGFSNMQLFKHKFFFRHSAAQYNNMFFFIYKKLVKLLRNLRRSSWISACVGSYVAYVISERITVIKECTVAIQIFWWHFMISIDKRNLIDRVLLTDKMMIIITHNYNHHFCAKLWRI